MPCRALVVTSSQMTEGAHAAQPSVPNWGPQGWGGLRLQSHSHPSFSVSTPDFPAEQSCRAPYTQA